MTQVLRYTAFASEPTGGNRAGVVLDAGAMTDAQMQALAADLGYSESAFVTGRLDHDDPVRIRYFAPEAEVAFCGHATIATAAAIAEHLQPGDHVLATAAGEVAVQARIVDGVATGALDSPPVGVRALADADVDTLLDVLGWSRSDLHPQYVPAIGTAGNQHPVLVAADPARLSRLDYRFEDAQRLCRGREWITLQLIAPMGPGRWRARDPFPYGGVWEDPATGSAAAAFVGYLVGTGHEQEAASFVIEQGVEMGRPSRIQVARNGDRARISGPATAVTG
ncbi:PhzF family phenazine biosynthesis protein [Dermacoccaceae bacterium W4C1]